MGADSADGGVTSPATGMGQDNSMNFLSSMADWLNSGDYPPHGFCLLWDPHLVALTWLGHCSIAIAYVLIPIMLLYVARRLREIAILPIWVLLEFAAFIFCCAMSHVLSLMELYYPIYWAHAIWVNVTGFVSLMTAVTFPFGIAIGVRKVAARAAKEAVTKILRDPDGRLTAE